jgi:hypothetical protein
MINVREDEAESFVFSLFIIPTSSEKKHYMPEDIVCTSGLPSLSHDYSELRSPPNELPKKEQHEFFSTKRTQ